MTLQDASVPIDQRVDELLAQMTVDEKLAELGCVWVTELVRDDEFSVEAAAEKLTHGIGQVTRIGASTGLKPDGSAALMNAIQEWVAENTRLGIPVVVHEESTGGFCARDATVFPTGIGLAATWDSDLVHDVADVIREQMVAVGARHTLAPVLDIARDPRWGRVEETYGEDPVLSGTIGTAYVRGVQGDLANGVVATGKHFLGYGLPEGGMNHAPVLIGPRELRDVYAEPFAAAIRDADLASIMNSYSSIDGLPCAGTPAILTELLRDELGFDGVVVADYFAVGLLMTHHHTAADKGEAARQALEAGLDMELPGTDCFGAPLRALVDDGTVSMEVVDRAVRRVLRSKFQLGLFEQPLVDAASAPTAYQTPVQRTLARRAAAESVILLANDGVLPLASDLSRLAVIGPGADDQRLVQGDYHYPAHVEMTYETDAGSSLLPEAGGAFAAGPYFTPHVTPLTGLQNIYGDRVVHAKGCEVTGDDRSGFDEAVAAASRADVAIVIAAGKSGLRPACTVGEARDAQDLGLTGVQNDLITAVRATGTPTVVVVLSGRVHTLAAHADANALVYLFPPGEEGGNGLADVLTGAVDATGRLPVTLPRHVGQVPIYHAQRWGGGRSLFYGDYTDGPTSPLFAFGHGLSYTTFDYGQPEIDAGSTSTPTRVTATVTNSGARRGTAVVQLYVTDVVASVARPQRQLIGFTRVGLDAGESTTVTFTVDASRLAFHDSDMRFVCEPGEMWFSVGSSSLDLKRATCVLAGDVTEHRQREVVATRVEVHR